MIHITWERWKNITVDPGGIPTVVKVSSLGRVKYKHKLLPFYINKSSYYVVHINHCAVRVHYLVAHAFLGKRLGDDWTIDHIDGNRRNNCVKNLELVSAEENLRRAKEMLEPNPAKIICGFNRHFRNMGSALNYYYNNVNNRPKQTEITLQEFQENVDRAAKLGSQYLGTKWTISLKEVQGE